MKVNIELQHLCIKPEHMRGIPIYTRELLRTLIKRSENEYSGLIFDYKKERGNRALLCQNLSGIIEETQIYECNDYDYRKIAGTAIQEKEEGYSILPYSKYIDTDIDLLHSTTGWGFPYYEDFSIVVTIHDIIPLLYPEWYKEIFIDKFKYAMENIKKRKDICVCADSMSTKQDLVNKIGIEEERIFVTYLGSELHRISDIDAKRILKNLRIESEYLLYLGALDERKGLKDIVEAFKIIKEHHSDIKLILAGKVNESYKEYVSELVDYKDIILLGYVSEEQKKALIQNAKIFLFPSQYEGFGIPILESMELGTPVITTDVSSLPEVGGDACVYVKPKDYEQLAYEIERLLDNEELRLQCVEKGYVQAQKFSWDKTAELTESVYEHAYNLYYN